VYFPALFIIASIRKAFGSQNYLQNDLNRVVHPFTHTKLTVTKTCKCSNFRYDQDTYRLMTKWHFAENLRVWKTR